MTGKNGCNVSERGVANEQGTMRAGLQKLRRYSHELL